MIDANRFVGLGHNLLLALQNSSCEDDIKRTGFFDILPDFFSRESGLVESSVLKKESQSEDNLETRT